MSRFVLEELSDFGDFSGNQKLSELLSFSNDERSRSRLSDVRVSPDGRHIHVLLRLPKVGLMTFDRQERPQLALNPKKLDVWLKGGHPIVDVFYLDLNRAKGAGAVAVVVYENGKAEFWKFLECKTGWHLLQTSDLCNSPRARVVSVSACSSILVWCEERPASESSPVLSSSRNKLRYCVCRRDWEVEDGAVSLGGLKIILHNNPKYTVISSGDYVHLLPYLKIKSQLCVSKFLLTWSPHHDSFTINTLCKNTPIKKLSAKESDFRRLVTDSLGYLSDVEPPEICSFSPTGCGGLLLLLSTGWLYLLQKDGIMRQVYKLAENFMLQDSHISLCMYADTVALIAGKTLHLLELNCGRELQKVALKREGLLYANQTERGIPHLLSDTGLFMLVEKDPTGKPLGSGPVEGVHPGALLVEAVFEEACKYYQQRSLSSTQLTVDILKKGGRFQAPISLASVLRNYLNSGLRRNDTEAIQNGADEYIAAHEKLMCSLEGELRALVSLEELKGSLVRGSVKEVEAVCESLVEKEVVRLLSSPELNREALLYLNSIFSIFPSQAWRAAQAALQLHYNGDGSLSSKASTDVWKTVLSPCPNSFLFANGQSKHSHSLRGDFNCKVKPAAPTSPAALPVFELLCQSVFHLQPSWLPRFLELSQQQQQGSAVLGLSLVSSSWGLSSGRGGEGGENNVPLYKRALWVLSNLNPDGDQRQELEVELLLVSGRPNAILQALRILMGKRQWERVTQVAQQFCKQSPLLNKEIFTSLLCEVAQHRELDPYLELLWALCPEDFTVTTILNLVLKNLPSSCSASPHTPFADTHSSQLTIGHLKPLLRKVLQRETKPSQRYADILQSPSYPPPALPRQPAEQASSIFNGNVDSAPSLQAETDEQTPPANTNTQRCDAVLAAAPVGFT